MFFPYNNLYLTFLTYNNKGFMTTIVFCSQFDRPNVTKRFLITWPWLKTSLKGSTQYIDFSPPPNMSGYGLSPSFLSELECLSASSAGLQRGMHSLPHSQLLVLWGRTDAGNPQRKSKGSASKLQIISCSCCAKNKSRFQCFPPGYYETLVHCNFSFNQF